MKELEKKIEEILNKTECVSYNATPGKEGYSVSREGTVEDIADLIRKHTSREVYEAQVKLVRRYGIIIDELYESHRAIVEWERADE